MRSWEEIKYHDFGASSAKNTTQRLESRNRKEEKQSQELQ